MRRARVFVHGRPAGRLVELDPGGRYRFEYSEDYRGEPVSLALPIASAPYEFDRFPPFFEGLLPEGVQLEALLLRRKLDAQDYFGQLVAVGRDLVGSVTVEEES
jgi:serine/threonine-protein kinase HipA